MSVFRKIKPSSINSPYKKDYEFLLMWLSPNGGVRQWFFSHTEGDRRDKYKNSTIDTDFDFRNVPVSQSIEIELNALSLSRSRYDYVTSLFETNRAILVNKDSTTIPIAIDNTTKKTERLQKDYAVSFKIMLQEPDLMNV